MRDSYRNDREYNAVIMPKSRLFGLLLSYNDNNNSKNNKKRLMVDMLFRRSHCTTSL